MTSPAPAAPVFISYARADAEAFAGQLRDALQAAGVPVWWDRARMDSRGLTFLQELQEAIRGCARLIVVMSPAVLASPYVRLEWEHGLLVGRALTPVLLAGEVDDYAGRVTVGADHGLPEDLTQLHWVDCRPSRPWSAALDELLRVLDTPPAAPGDLHGVPALPPHHLPRSEALARLADALLGDLARPCVISAVEQTAAVQGMGGVGKTVLAAAFARSTPVRRAFPDGIFWLTMPAEDSDEGVLAVLRALAAALGAQLAPDADPAAAAGTLARALATRRCLLVLDDLWHVRTAVLLRDAAGPAVRLLITTRMAALAADLGAQAETLDVLSTERAEALLARWMDVQVSALPPLATMLIKACGHLPLAIAMIGALLRTNPERIGLVLERLARFDLARFERRLPHYGHPNLARALGVSVDALEPRMRAAYEALAVFAPREPVAELAVAVLLAADGWTQGNVADFIDTLLGRSLARRAGPGAIRLHDLQHAYLAGVCPDLPALHRRLVEAYRALCREGWHAVPQDGYIALQLAGHLRAGGLIDECAALASDVRWLQAKLDALRGGREVVTAASWIGDLEPALAPAHGHALRQFANQAVHALRLGALVAAQVLARLSPEERSLAALRADAALHPPILEPLRPSLWRARGPQRIITVDGHATVEMVLLEPEGHAVVGTLAAYDNIVVMDLTTGERLAVLSDPDIRLRDTYNGEAGIVALAATAGRRRLLTCAEHEHVVKVWDLASGQVLARLPTPGRVAAFARPAQAERVVSVAGNELQVWDLEALQPIVRIKGLPATRTSGSHTIANEWHAVATDPALRCAVAGDAEGRLAVYDLADGRLLAQTAAHSHWVEAVAIEPVSGLVISSSWGDGEPTARLWRWPGLEPAGTLEAPGGAAKFLVPVPGEARLLLATKDVVALWDLDARCRIAEQRQHGASFTDLALASDGSVLTCDLDQTLRRWDMAAAAADPAAGPLASAPHVEPHMSPVYALAVSPDGRWIASAGTEDVEVQLRDGSGAPVCQLHGHNAKRLALAWLPHGDTLVSAGRDGRLIGWDPLAAAQRWCLETGMDDVTMMLSFVTARGACVAVGDWQGRLAIWEVATGVRRGTIQASGPIRSLAPGPGPGQLLVGTEDAFEVWTALPPTRVAKVPVGIGIDNDEHFVVGIAALADGHVLCASTEGGLYRMPAMPGPQDDDDLALDDEERLDRVPVSWPHPTSVAASADGCIAIVAARRSKSIVVYDARAELKRIGEFHGDSDMLACACSADARLIAAADTAGQVHVLRWNRRSISASP